MTTDGKQGRCPWWFGVLHAAERLHCRPWEIEPSDPPMVWLWRQQAADTERHAAQQRQQWDADSVERRRKALAMAQGTG